MMEATTQYHPRIKFQNRISRTDLFLLLSFCVGSKSRLEQTILDMDNENDSPFYNLPSNDFEML